LYRREPNGNLPLGSNIENATNIYFDFNALISTKKAVNNYVFLVGFNNESKVQNISIYLYPSNGIFIC